MLDSITTHTVTTATQAARDSLAVVPPALRQKDDDTDVYERPDGTTATRFDAAQPATESPANADDQLFRELLHKFIGQTFIGQMLKSMRATQEKNPLFHGGHAEDMYQGLLDMELTDKLTQATSRTLSEPMYKLMRAPRAV
jgi:hypothetical protein